MNYAPIGITTYTRLSHLKQTISALRANTLAGHSDLFVFSDGAQPGDEGKVAQLREYCRTIGGFKTVEVVEWPKNIGASANARLSREQLIRDYGSMIRMEDDIVTAKGFLAFVNAALDHYQDDKRIFSVTGYCPPLALPAGLGSDVFFLARYSPWGAGFWKRSLALFPDEISEAAYRTHNKATFTRWGDDLPRMIEREIKKKLDAQDVRNTYHQVISEQYTVYPRKSLVRNIGFDGSGIHCGVTDRFEVELWEKESGFDFADPVVDERIVSSYRRFLRIPFNQRVMARLKRSLFGRRRR